MQNPSEMPMSVFFSEDNKRYREMREITLMISEILVVITVLVT